MEISKLKPFDNNNVSFKDNLKFIIPSLIGILLFMIPVKYEGDITIPIAICSGKLVDFLGSYLVYIITITMAISAIFTFIGTVLKPKFITNNKFLSSLFTTTPLWLVLEIFRWYIWSILLLLK